MTFWYSQHMRLWVYQSNNHTQLSSGASNIWYEYSFIFTGLDKHKFSVKLYIFSYS